MWQYLATLKDTHTCDQAFSISGKYPKESYISEHQYLQEYRWSSECSTKTGSYLFALCNLIYLLSAITLSYVLFYCFFSLSFASFQRFSCTANIPRVSTKSLLLTKLQLWMYGNWVLERLSRLSKITQIKNGRIGVQTHICITYWQRVKKNEKATRESIKGTIYSKKLLLGGLMYKKSGSEFGPIFPLW